MSDSCRICLEQDSPKKLITPCACTGTQKFVHRDCLAKWQKVIIDGSSVNPDNYNIETARVCSVCKAEYSVPLPTQSLYDKSIKFSKYFFALTLGVIAMLNSNTSKKFKILATCILGVSFCYLPLLLTLLLILALPFITFYVKGMRLSYVVVMHI
jgi:E3 ubiquitin-protein ligase DOA10